MLEWQPGYQGSKFADTANERFMIVRQTADLSGRKLWRWRVDVYPLHFDDRGHAFCRSAEREAVGGRDDMRLAKALAETTARKLSAGI